MPSSWDVYYVVFLSATLALGIPAFLALVSFLVAPDARRERAARPLPPSSFSVVENQTTLGRRINARFFLGVNAALILITLGLALIPAAGMIQPSGDHGLIIRGLVAIVTIAGFAVLGLLYSARKGDLSWITSFQPEQGGKCMDAHEKVMDTE